MARFWTAAADLAPLKEGEARMVEMFGVEMPDRTAMVPKAEADRLWEALKVAQAEIAIQGPISFASACRCGRPSIRQVVSSCRMLGRKRSSDRMEKTVERTGNSCARSGTGSRMANSPGS